MPPPSAGCGAGSAARKGHGRVGLQRRGGLRAWASSGAGRGSAAAAPDNCCFFPLEGGGDDDDAGALLPEDVKVSFRAPLQIFFSPPAAEPIADGQGTSYSSESIPGAEMARYYRETFERMGAEEKLAASLVSTSKLSSELQQVRRETHARTHSHSLAHSLTRSLARSRSSVGKSRARWSWSTAPRASG